MMRDQVLTEGRVAVVTGAASGIGLAASKRFASLGMRVCMVDINKEALGTSGAAVAAIAADETSVITRCADVSDRAAIVGVKDAVYQAFGEVALLMNNAAHFGVADGTGGTWDSIAIRQRQIDVNLYGVIHGVHVFVPAMLEQNTPCMVVNTGSKQGITSPFGSVYATTKAGIKIYTEELQHELRNTEGCKVSAHLLVPGWTSSDEASLRKGAWKPEQVIDYLYDALGSGSFYIVCPDGQVTSELDRKRILWAAGDIIHNRPAVSRWHPDYADEFESFNP